jgi:hypothetical protein
MTDAVSQMLVGADRVSARPWEAANTDIPVYEWEAPGAVV